MNKFHRILGSIVLILIVAGCSAVKPISVENFAGTSLDDFIKQVPGDVTSKYPDKGGYPHLVKKQSSSLIPGSAVAMSMNGYYQNLDSNFTNWCAANGGKTTLASRTLICRNSSGQTLGGFKHDFIATSSSGGNATTGDAYYYFYNQQSFASVDANLKSVSMLKNTQQKLQAEKNQSFLSKHLVEGDLVCQTTSAKSGNADGAAKITAQVEKDNGTRMQVRIGGIEFSGNNYSYANGTKNEFTDNRGITFIRGNLVWVDKQYWSDCP
jgi:hypothetical protein